MGTAWLHCVHGFAPDDVYVAGEDGAHQLGRFVLERGGQRARPATPGSCRHHVEALAGRPLSRAGYLAPTGEVFLPDGYLTVIRP